MRFASGQICRIRFSFYRNMDFLSYCKVLMIWKLSGTQCTEKPTWTSLREKKALPPILSTKLEFVNSSEQVEIRGDKSLDTYNNYFIGNDPSKWQSNCKVYQAVIYKNIYPNIDLRYYTENDQLKYDLVVHPGGNPDNIILKYKGADKLIVRNGQITVQTSV